MTSDPSYLWPLMVMALSDLWSFLLWPLTLLSRLETSDPSYPQPLTLSKLDLWPLPKFSLTSILWWWSLVCCSWCFIRWNSSLKPTMGTGMRLSGSGLSSMACCQIRGLIPVVHKTGHYNTHLPSHRTSKTLLYFTHAIYSTRMSTFQLYWNTKKTSLWEVYRYPPSLLR